MPWRAQFHPRNSPSLNARAGGLRHDGESLGPCERGNAELSELEISLKDFFAKHWDVRRTTRKLHEDLRVHVLEQMTEIEGLRQNAENSHKAIKHLETLLNKETAKHSSFNDLSAKVQVLEAENESLKAFMSESSEKENQARKELSALAVTGGTSEKLKKSQHSNFLGG
ncbi:hypothetical protein QYE76_071725 [Lolium multiflorum]|uniref:Uncharacterized protein n=1 Tax=Lolium multiflorum TaxID=4521 RepID=A0AAD8SKC2_LOLMU|nr:hypothetical protein QYE76_071725 [Lolium multiflorum]